MNDIYPPPAELSVVDFAASIVNSGAVVEDMEGRMPPVSPAGAIHDDRGQENENNVDVKLLSLVDGRVDPCDLA